MNNSLFSSKNHYEYLRQRLKRGASERGTKTQLAHFMNVQPAFLSQVLSEKNFLSLEQADLVNQFFDHSTEEADFFILLVSRDRAGTKSLEKYFANQISDLLKKRMLIVERLGRRGEISDESRGIYYSSWLYSAIHIMCSIPGLNTRRALSERLQVPIEVVGKILDFLEEQQLLIKEDHSYKLTQTWIRLDNGSPHLVKHHTNWRLRAVDNLESRDDLDLHYSGVFAVDKSIAQKLKNKFLEFLKEEMSSIEAAKSEEIFVMGIDWFRLK